MRKQTDHRQQIHKDYDVLISEKKRELNFGWIAFFVRSNKQQL